MLRLLATCCAALAACGAAPRQNSDDCVDLTHFDPNIGDPTRGKWDLRVVGSGFDADEGMRMRLFVTLGEPSYALAEAPIRNGAFEIAMPQTIEPYTGLGAYIDRGRDDACDIAVDSLWQMTTGGVFRDHLWQLTPATQQPAGAPPCNINGIFDLTARRPCSR